MSADPDLCQFYVSELWVHLLSAQLLKFDEVVGKANFTSAHLIFSAEALFVCFFLSTLLQHALYFTQEETEPKVTQRGG